MKNEKNRTRFLLPALLVALLAVTAAGCGGSSSSSSDVDPSRDDPAALVVGLALVRPDGTQLALTDRPLPRTLSLHISLSAAVADTARESFSSALTVRDANDDAIAGTTSWNDEGTILTWTPTAALAYQQTYTIEITAATASSSRTLADLDHTFTTMTQYDVDGDGFADLPVCSPYAYEAIGNVTIYDGNAAAGGTMTPLVAIDNPIETAEGWFGFGVGCALEDIDADGYADLAATLLSHSDGEDPVPQGRILLFRGSDLAASGGQTTVTSAFLAVDGEDDNSQLGFVMLPLGDIDGDGYGDIASRVIRDGPTDLILFSGHSLVASAAAGTTAITADAETALAIITNPVGILSFAPMGDLDGDGLTDLAIGGVLSAELPRATVFILGGDEISARAAAGNNVFAADATSAASVIQYAREWGGFAETVANVGDVTGDGIDDLMVGAFEEDVYVGESDYDEAGCAYLFSGAGLSGTQTSLNALAHISGPPVENGHFGEFTAAALGDIDGDGLEDFAMQVDDYTDGETYSGGAAFFFHGSDLAPALSASDAFAIRAESTGDHGGLGRTMLGGLSLDNDGIGDVAIALPQYGDSEHISDRTGAVFILSGAALEAGDTTAIAGLLGVEEELLGYSIGANRHYEAE